MILDLNRGTGIKLRFSSWLSLLEEFGSSDTPAAVSTLDLDLCILAPHKTVPWRDGRGVAAEPNFS